MIRTNFVSLCTCNGVAYREKLPAGGSRVVILQVGVKQPGIAEISKASGEPIPAKRNPKNQYSLENFQEAITLTAGLPYSNQKPVKLNGKKAAEVEEEPAVIETLAAEEALVDSEAYQKIVQHYTDKKGRLSYDLLNKEMIKSANSSSVVRKMLEEGEGVDGIAQYVAGSRFRNVAENPNLSDEEVTAIIELLDEVSPRGIFTEFNEEMRRKQAELKKR